MDTISGIIKSWPSAPEMGRDIGVEPGLIRAWSARNSIPPKYWADIIEAAASRGIEGVSLECLADISAKAPDLVMGAARHP